MILKKFYENSDSRKLFLVSEFRKEAIGIGITNFFGSFFNTVTAMASLSKSALKYESGAKTQLCDLWSCIVLFSNVQLIFLLLRSKEAGRFEKLLSFTRSQSILARGSVSLSGAIT